MKQAESGHATPKSAHPAALAVTAMLVALSALIDPAFYAGVVFAARQPQAWQTVLAMLVWVLMSQSALVVVGLATLLGLYEPVHRLIVAVETRWARPIAWTLTVLLALLGIFCVAQGIAQWHGHWLVPHHRR